ncbi:MAG: alpha/beta hydrolase [Methanoregula sp.]|jgi:hypothetical protein
MNFPITDEILLVKGRDSFLLAAKVSDDFPLCIETFAEEYCQGIQSGDLVVVSAPEGGPVEPAVMLLTLVRTYHTPLVVLPKDHPGSKRLSCVVSVGPEIHTDCTIIRGTHPEQHLVCAAGELAGLTIRADHSGITIDPFPETLAIERINPQVILKNG